MLDAMNRLAHGYVATAVILACRERRLFDLLQTGPKSDHALGVALRANPGHLAVAVRMLESLDWLRRDGGLLRLGEGAKDRAKIPAALAAVYRDPALAADGGLAARLADALAGWNGASPTTAELLDGALLTPLLLALKTAGGGLERLDLLPPAARRDFIAVLERKAWAQTIGGAPSWTEGGAALFERIFACATVVSYRPMLSRLDELIFGDPASVFHRRADEAESHVDRTMNVLGSGFQHQRYFDEACEAIVEAFQLHGDDFAAQPRYIMDTGCGDGALLRAAYQAVARTPRGAVLDRFPLTLIGVDLNAEALDRTARTLDGLPHLLVAGDIADPEGILRSAAALGVDDAAAILHVRSFLDHDRPYAPPSPGGPQPVGRSGAVCVDGMGARIPPDEAARSLAEQLDRWGRAIGPHGLIALEVHTVDAATAGLYADACESLHFDAYHGFSGQQLVEPELYLAAAACAGLWPCRPVRRRPEGFAFTRITLSHFQRRPGRVRAARREDLDRLCEIEARCWPESLRTPTPVLQRRLETQPQEQFLLEVGGRVVGACYTQTIGTAEALATARWDGLADLRDPEGRVLQLLGLVVDPEARATGLGDELIDFVLAWAACCNRIDSVAGVSRCSGLDEVEAPPARAADVAVRAAARDAEGRLADPTLRFHEGHGAQVVGLVEDFRPADAVNAGAGVLIAYSLDKAGHVAGRDPTPLRSPAEVRALVEHQLSVVLGPRVKDADFGSQPFMELGLDSVQLLRLRNLIGDAVGRKLESAFLFRHNTVASVTAALTAETAPAASASPHRPAADGSPVAVIGLACRFPGGDADGFWNLLVSGRDGVRAPPAERWWWPVGDEADRRFEQAGYLDAVDAFDARFFRMSPKEAMLLDPQQRLLLEVVWDAIEDAGYKASALRGRAAGVWIGACNYDYRELVERATPSGMRVTGSFGSILSGRLSHVYDLRGPSLTVDAACASSLGALHSAVRALRSGDCEMAVVGGVAVIATPTNTRSFAAAGMLSPRGRCRTFDAGADGYARGEGCGVVILKPLDRALADGDQVYGLIVGSGMSHGGQSNSLIAPSPQGQTDAIVSAYRDAGFAPRDVSYVEVHGTGTAQGDPVEIAGLKDAFRQLSSSELAGDEAPTCVLGAVKTNIGHLEGAAGMASLIKVLLALRHEHIPANLHFESLNPEIDFEGTPFRVAATATAWPQQGDARRAGLSAFGIGGANAHILVQAPPRAAEAAIPTATPALIVLSARTRKQLLARAQALLSRLRRTDLPPVGLCDVAWTLQVGRDEMTERLAIVARSIADLDRQLEAVLAGDGPDNPAKVGAPALADAARIWLEGGAVDWRSLLDCAQAPPARISLPGYPFDRQRYWITPEPVSIAAAAE